MDILPDFLNLSIFSSFVSALLMLSFANILSTDTVGFPACVYNNYEHFKKSNTV